MIITDLNSNKEFLEQNIEEEKTRYIVFQIKCLYQGLNSYNENEAKEAISQIKNGVNFLCSKSLKDNLELHNIENFPAPREIKNKSSIKNLAKSASEISEELFNIYVTRKFDNLSDTEILNSKKFIIYLNIIKNITNNIESIL